MSRLDIALDLTSLAAGYAGGSFTPVDVIDEIYARIAETDPAIWITLQQHGEARAAASTAPRGPLHGVPFAVKDNIDCAGLPTTCACPQFAYTPARSAHVVELLEAAGAIVIGKTNLDQFATGLNGTRSPYGIPENPFDASFIPGGSSSGSAVAVARGLVSFALGTDTAGSGRVPAAFNNIVGLKPTKGTLSARGLVPACRTLDTMSVFALTVSDAWAVYDAAAHFDPEDAFCRQRPAESNALVAPAMARLGVPRDLLASRAGDAAGAPLQDAIARAQALGHTIVAIDYAPFADAARLLYQGPWVAERYAAIKDFIRDNAAAIEPSVREIILAAEKLSAADAFDGIYRLAACVRAAEVQWQAMDIMLLPSAPAIYTRAEMLADPIALNTNLGRYTNFVNLMDLSALAVPTGRDAAGLPFGVTLIAPPFADRALAAVGDAMHRALPDARLGATATPLSATPTLSVAQPVPGKIKLAVVGAHLTGQPLNSQLTERGAHLIETTQTAPGYSLYALANTAPAKPGLIFDGQGHGGIEVEIWEMDIRAFGSFVALIPPPLGIGTLTLRDGARVKGFLCEAHAVAGAEDITSYGGWRRWLSAAALSDRQSA